MRAWLKRLLPLLVVPCVPRAVAAQPNIGHRIPGTVGLDAGTQARPGVYVANRFVYYDVIALRDRDGERIVVPGLETRAIANAFAVAGTLKLRSGLHLGASVAAPVARLWVSVDDRRGTLDRFGLGDVFVKPVQVGGRWKRLDLVALYGFYAPTRQLQREGLAGPQWSHQFSAGGTLHFDEDRRWRLSALASYDLYQRKLGIDITRGDSIQIQGGIGGAPLESLEIGLAGYALWQVRDDRGTDLPEPLRGRRDRVFGLGPEVNLLLSALRAKLGVRYTRDFGVQSRPEGHLFVLSLGVQLWSPSGRRDSR